MDSPQDDALEAFAENVARNLAKNGYPQQKVAFPLERMYEAAAKKELSFNRVLELLASRGIRHEKTLERIIFLPPAAMPSIEGFDPAALEGMSPAQMMEAAAQVMQQMPPEQLEAMRQQLEGMSEEDRAKMLEQAKAMGLL